MSKPSEYVIRNARGRLVLSLFTRRPMRLSKALAEETRADLDFEDRENAPHRIEPVPAELIDPPLSTPLDTADDERTPAPRER